MKKSGIFDVAMGSYDGAECCELIGLFMLHNISKELPGNFGLYRDDGLGAINATPRNIEIVKKKLCKIFKDHGLKITVEANSKIVNYLDITLDLTSGKVSPYMKPNNKLLYVNRLSNHPQQIIENIPKGINKRLTSISSDNTIFEKSLAPYQEALRTSGYSHKLVYDENITNRHSHNRNRNRKIIWFNPPFSNSVATNIGKRFLKIIEQEFPPTHILHQIFNRNTIKISYSCMRNLRSIIDSHNKKILKKKETEVEVPTKECNCRRPNDCPLEGKCKASSLVYQATVSTADKTETYVGSTACEFKTRYNNHKASFKHSSKRNSTELSKYIWSLKDKNINYNLKWSIVTHAPACKNGNSVCGLCLTEKYVIIFQPSIASLNDRKALISSCRHASKFTLANYKS